MYKVDKVSKMFPRFEINIRFYVPTIEISYVTKRS